MKLTVSLNFEDHEYNDIEVEPLYDIGSNLIEDTLREALDEVRVPREEFENIRSFVIVGSFEQPKPLKLSPRTFVVGDVIDLANGRKLPTGNRGPYRVTKVEYFPKSDEPPHPQFIKFVDADGKRNSASGYWFDPNVILDGKLEKENCRG